MRIGTGICGHMKRSKGAAIDFGIDRFEGDIFRKVLKLGVCDSRRLLGLAGFGLELAIDTDIGILIKTGIGFEPRFGLCVPFEDVVIMVEEA